jgi:hypothetical protein
MSSVLRIVLPVAGGDLWFGSDMVWNGLLALGPFRAVQFLF